MRTPKASKKNPPNAPIKPKRKQEQRRIKKFPTLNLDSDSGDSSFARLANRLTSIQTDINDEPIRLLGIRPVSPLSSETLRATTEVSHLPRRLFDARELRTRPSSPNERISSVMQTLPPISRKMDNCPTRSNSPNNKRTN